jgi:2-dehydro-3-deoxyphosphogalactonate aldolase
MGSSTLQRKSGDRCMARFLIYPYNEGCNAKMTSSATRARCNVEEVAFPECLLVAIRRWITPEESEPVTDTLITACFGAIEIPPNSPNPYASIRRLSQRFGSETLIGAGTIMSAVEVGRVCEAGRNLFVMPPCRPRSYSRSEGGHVHLPSRCRNTYRGFRRASRPRGPPEAVSSRSALLDALKAWRAAFSAEIPLPQPDGIGADVSPYIAAACPTLSNSRETS